MAVAISPDGKLLAMDSRTHSVMLAHAATGAGIRHFQGHVDPISALAFTVPSRSLKDHAVLRGGGHDPLHVLDG